jgi:hypothetical protein
MNSPHFINAAWPPTTHNNKSIKSGETVEMVEMVVFMLQPTTKEDQVTK